MKSFTRIAFQGGHIYEVPTAVIAADRTNYYATQDPDRTREQHAAETAMMFASEFEVVDWAKNNMNWSDIEKHARMIGFTPPDLKAGWDEAELSFHDDRGMPDATSLGERSLAAPLELAIGQAFSEDRRCMILAFQHPDTQHINTAAVILTGGDDVVKGYIGAISQFDEFLSTRPQIAPGALSMN